MKSKLEGQFALVVRFDPKPDLAEDFDELVEGTIGHIRASEPGTFAYLINDVSDAPTSRVFYELYRDKEAFEEHERQPHVKRFLAERGDYLESEPIVWWLAPTGGVTRTDAGDADG